MAETLPRLRWASVAQDLALFSIPNSPIPSLGNICDTYGVSEEELRELLTQNTEFQLVFQKAMEDVESWGSRAGAKYRAMMLSQTLAEKLFRDAQAGVLEPKDALKLLEILTKASGLDKDTSQVQVNTQVNVPLGFPHGVKKVERYVAAVEACNG